MAEKLGSVPKGGKNVKSSEPRKALVVAAFKAEVPGCSKVTLLKEKAPGVFVASCLKYGGDRKYEDLGYWTVEVPAAVAK